MSEGRSDPALSIRAEALPKVGSTTDRDHLYHATAATCEANISRLQSCPAESYAHHQRPATRRSLTLRILQRQSRWFVVELSARPMTRPLISSEDLIRQRSAELPSGVISLSECRA